MLLLFYIASFQVYASIYEYLFIEGSISHERRRRGHGVRRLFRCSKVVRNYVIHIMILVNKCNC